MASCATSPIKPPEQIIVRETVRVLPPAEFLQSCTSQPTDQTILAELKRLDKLVRCERADKAALRAWAGEEEEGDPL